MEVITNIEEMRHRRRQLDEPVGFLPTMGYLHEGHLSLVREAKNRNRSVVVSIFVNPTQFGPSEDLNRYPRNTEGDLALLAQIKTDIVFLPSAAEMYPDRFDSWVEVGSLTRHLEGAARPTHFRGVTTVVAKLFHIVQPTIAYFGQKDAQQALVIKKLVRDLNMNLDVVVLPTVREPDGLAMSSRNTYLTPEQRRAAVVLYQALKQAQSLWSQGEHSAETVRRQMIDLIRKEPLAEIDYVSLADAETLEELDSIDRPSLVSLAVNIGATRLIDNTVLR